MFDDMVADRANTAPTTWASMHALALAYVAAIAVAEAVGALVGIVPGAILHALIVVALLNQYAWIGAGPRRRVLPALALVSTLRILSVTMPIKGVPVLAWYALVGVPLLVTIGVALWAMRLRLPQLAFPRHQWGSQVLIACWGAPLSLIGYLIARPAPIIGALTPLELASAALILTVFVGVAEEVLFRGLLQSAMEAVFGRDGILWAAAVFAFMNLGSLSAGYVLFTYVVGLGFGWAVRRSGTLWGVILAHGIVTTGMLCVWPFVLR